MINNPETYTDNAYRFIASLFSAWMIWLAIWGFIGLFAKLTAKETPIVRYLVDASYWLYILHLPFTIWIPGYLANQEWNSFTKFGITLFLTSLIGLLSYDLFVRPTWLGALLNGRRYPRALLQALSNKPFSKPE